MADRDGLNAAANEVVIANATGDADLFHEKVTSLIAMVRALPASPQPSPHATDFEPAYKDWQDKTDFIQQWMNSGKLPAKYLGWHRADVMRELIENALAQPAAVEPATVPKGWKLVPVEPTDEMVKAADESRKYKEDDGDTEGLRINSINTWDAMLAAAPSPAVAEPARKAIDAQGAEILVSAIQTAMARFDLLARNRNHGAVDPLVGYKELDAAISAYREASPLPAATLGKLDGLLTVDGLIAKYGFCNWQAQDVIKQRDTLLAQQPAASDVRDAEWGVLESFVRKVAIGAYAYGELPIKATVALQRHAAIIRALQSTPTVHAGDKP